jgi:hypothetical protein
MYMMLPSARLSFMPGIRLPSPPRVPGWRSWLAVARAMRRFDRLQTLELAAQRKEAAGRVAAALVSVPARKRAKRVA